MIYLCSGKDSEKTGLVQDSQHSGRKTYRSGIAECRLCRFLGFRMPKGTSVVSGCAAYGMGKDYLTGSPIRQDYLETAIKWINNGDIEGYMATHQHKPNAVSLWNYFQSIISWVEATFRHKRKQMKGVDWGNLYNDYKGRRT